MGDLLEVQGIKPGEIAYNPAVIIQNDTKIIAARVESLNSNWLHPELYDPHVIFFTQHGNILKPIPDTPVFDKLEDPWATWLKNPEGEPRLLFGGVKVDYGGETPVITTRLYLAQSVQELNPGRPAAVIRHIKDIRATQLGSGKIAVFTRPTTGEAFPGRIGFVIIDDISEIEQSIADAKLLKFNLDKNIKIGANEAYPITKTGPAGIKKEFIHVFCHIASTDPIKQNGKNVLDFEIGPIHYTGCRFEFDPDSPYSNVIVLDKVAGRSDFPVNNGLSKGKRYNDVIFPGGTGGPDETLYFAGIEDARIGVMDIKK